MVSKTLKYLVLGAVVALGFAPEQSIAQTTVDTSFQVLATVNANCLQQAATNINHDVYDPMALGDDDAAGTITVRCTNGTPYTVALNVGTGGGTFVTRTLDNAGSKLNYNLYYDSNRTNVWGDSVGVNTVSGTGAGLGVPQQQSHPVYSRIPAGQYTAAPGSYSSTIQVSITY